MDKSTSVDGSGVPAFIGIDLGWYRKPSGLALFRWVDRSLQLGDVTRITAVSEIRSWIARNAGLGTTVIAVDAPTIIRNPSGVRPAERALNSHFTRFHAGCYPANLSRPFANYVLQFSEALEAMGFAFDTEISPQGPGRF